MRPLLLAQSPLLLQQLLLVPTLLLQPLLLSQSLLLMQPLLLVQPLQLQPLLLAQSLLLLQPLLLVQPLLLQPLLLAQPLLLNRGTAETADCRLPGQPASQEVHRRSRRAPRVMWFNMRWLEQRVYPRAYEADNGSR